MNASDRAHLNFENEARQAFAFLGDLGFSEIEALPTLVRCRMGSVKVDVYHGQQSYEIEQVLLRSELDTQFRKSFDT